MSLDVQIALISGWANGGLGLPNMGIRFHAVDRTPSAFSLNRSSKQTSMCLMREYKRAKLVLVFHELHIEATLKTRRLGYLDARMHMYCPIVSAQPVWSKVEDGHHSSEGGDQSIRTIAEY